MVESRFDAWIRRVLFAPDFLGVAGLSKPLLFGYFWIRESASTGINVRAMALSYLLLFNLVPAAAVAASVFTSLPSLAGDREQFLGTVIGSIIPVEEQQIVAQISRFTANAAKVGTIGGLVLLYFTINLARTIENAVNHVWRVSRRRPLVQAWSGMALALLVGTAVTALWLRMLNPLVGEAFEGRPIGSQLTAGLLTFVAFFLFFFILPYTRVRIRSALFGAALTAGGWLLARYLFATYARRLVSYDTLYGTLGVLPLFLLWIYLSWLVVLAGCVAARVFQDYDHLEDRERYRLGGVRNHVYWSFVILAKIGRSFKAGADEIPPLFELASAAGQPASLFEELADRMVRHGILAPWHGREGVYIPARALDMIRLSDVPKAVERDPFSVPEHHGEREFGHSEGLIAKLLSEASAPGTGPLADWTLEELVSMVAERAVDKEDPDE